MSSIVVFRQIVIKQIITEESIKIARDQINNAMLALNQAQEEFEKQKTTTLTEYSIKGADASTIEQLRHHFDMKGSDFHVQKDELQTKLLQLAELKLGDEVVIDTIEGPYELKVGDKIEAAIHTEVMVKDGVIVEIR